MKAISDNRSTKLDKENIVFFDGVCVLCNSSVDLLMKMDKKNTLKFASLQGKTAQVLLSNNQLENLDSIVFFTGNALYEKSDAALEILRKLGGFWQVFLVFKWIPKSWRDGIYSWVAKNRYRWFGKRETCRVPSEKEKKCLLS